jgi:hypothetical protein
MAIQFRRALAVTWTSVNPVLADGQPGLEKDTRKVKYGDGVTAWNDLPYAAGGSGGAVDSVAGKTGAVSLTKSDVGLTNVDNTADTAKPVSTTQATAISGAQTAAVSAAATDATTKANAAQSAATTAAATDATSNAAQSAAIATAATDATTKADAAKARATHTGTQAISTVTGLQTAIDAKITNPAGAVDGQILAKSGSTEAWVDVPDGSLPTGGTDGQILAKSGTTGVWTDAPPSTPADGSITTVKLGPAAVTAAKLGADVTQDAVPDGTTAKQFTATNQTKLSGIAAGATVNSTDAALRDRSTHTGTQSADTLTDGTTNKAFLATERTKLTGIATGATANQSDATTNAAIAAKEATITAGTTGQVWRGDKSWVTADKTLVGLANVDNTSDAAKPVSTATATALAGKETPAGAQAKADAALFTATSTAAQKVSNLADLPDLSAARGNLGAASATALTSTQSDLTDLTDTVDDHDTSITALSSSVSAKANNDATGITAGTWRTALGLGDAAQKNTGTAAGTLAAGNDTRITGAAQKASNLSDLASASTARTNLGLGTAAVVDTGTGTGNAILGNDARLTDTRTPTDATVTLAKAAPALIDPTTGAGLRTVGVTAGTVASGKVATVRRTGGQARLLIGGNSIMSSAFVAITPVGRMLAALNGAVTCVGQVQVFANTEAQQNTAIKAALVDGVTKPTHVMWNGGENDLTGTKAAWLATRLDTIRAVQAAGAVPIIIGLYPVGSASDADGGVARKMQNHDWNESARKQAWQESAVFLDPRGPGLENPTTGMYATGMTLDGTHPNTLGHKASVDYMIPQLQAIFGASGGRTPVPHTNVTWATAATPSLLGEANLIANAMFDNTLASATPSNTSLPAGGATGWRKVDVSGSGTSTGSIVADTDFYTGRAWECIVPVGRSTRFEYVLPTPLIPAVGRQVKYSARVKITQAPDRDSDSAATLFFGPFTTPTVSTQFASTCNGYISLEGTQVSTSSFTGGIVLTAGAAASVGFTVRIGDMTAFDTTDL